MPRFRQSVPVALAAAMLLAAGCRVGSRTDPSPTKAGLHVRDLIDIPAQMEADELNRMANLAQVSREMQSLQRRRAAAEDPGFLTRPPRHVLCLSGGGSYGAFTAGVICGWTQSGLRPDFDVVTGISTGSLVAPFAFLGPRYDGILKRLFTEIHNRDIYRKQYVRGLFQESFASNAPLAAYIDDVVTAEILEALAVEHRRGRRLYLGTTELEGKRFIVWDIGAIACRGKGDEDRRLICRILLGSSAIPGFFPPTEIAVTVNGQTFSEKHGDGGVSQAIFFRAPYVTPQMRPFLKPHSLADTQVWCVVAGKLYPDEKVIKGRALDVAGKSIDTILYSQTRGDLQRIFMLVLLTGMDYNLMAIPQEFDAPKSATEFEPEPMGRLFDEGVKLVSAGVPWRKLPPGTHPDEQIQERGGTCLTNTHRGDAMPR